MTDKIKSSFNSIRAEDELKRGTMRFLQNELARRKAKTRRLHPVRYAAVFACFVIIFVSGMFTNAYFMPDAYVDIDVNPSLELTLNRFGRVIGTHNYNDDGGDVIGSSVLRHKNYEDALVILLAEMAQRGYIEDNSLVSVTLQTDDKKRESALLASIQAGLEVYIAGHHQAAQIDVFPVSRDTRNESFEQGVSPAKYLAIRELMSVDPAASIESCKGHSISEIKELTREHGKHHNGGAGSESSSDSSAEPEHDSDDTQAEPESVSSGNHGKSGRKGKHHGGGH